MSRPDPSGDFLRLDKWLWQARFAKSRGQAADLCRSALLRVNRVRVTHAHHRVRVGDVLTLPVRDEVRVIRICALGKRRGPAAEARCLYEELPPAPGHGPQASPMPFGTCPTGASVL
ncbi:MAG: S4 domain-containing protein [Alphaproteobacteria bacterium]